MRSLIKYYYYYSETATKHNVKKIMLNTILIGKEPIINFVTLLNVIHVIKSMTDVIFC